MSIRRRLASRVFGRNGTPRASRRGLAWNGQRRERSRPSAGASFRPPSAAADRKVRAPREPPRRGRTSVPQPSWHPGGAAHPAGRHFCSATLMASRRSRTPGGAALLFRNPHGIPAGAAHPAGPHFCSATLMASRRGRTSVLQTSWRHCGQCACSRDSPSGQARALGARTFRSASGKHRAAKRRRRWMPLPGAAGRKTRVPQLTDLLPRYGKAPSSSTTVQGTIRSAVASRTRVTVSAGTGTATFPQLRRT